MVARRHVVWLVVAAVLPVVPAAGQASGQGSADTAFWAPAVPPRAHYSITCAVDPATGRLRGAETIRLTNSAQQAIHHLALDWSVDAGDFAWRQP